MNQVMKPLAIGVGTLALSYLLIVLLIIAIEVYSGAVVLLEQIYWVGTIAYVIGCLALSLKTLQNKAAALLVGLVCSVVGCLLIIVIGVNFKFLIGGRI